MADAAQPEACVRLVVYQDPNADSDGNFNLTLRIPIAEIEALCLRPVKFLRFVAWAILGVDGVISRTRDGPAIADEEALLEGETYYYDAIGRFFFLHLPCS